MKISLPSEGDAGDPFFLLLGLLVGDNGRLETLRVSPFLEPRLDGAAIGRLGPMLLEDGEVGFAKLACQRGPLA